ncbi:protein EMSY-LIKE 3-like [Olea europaea var. sylvestris]|uniref:protein EMSY-LIKE 3-like n=1 Tax=Olea europaea var. sylvestris TaxID=158386 RepID=UPI000C1D2952|nr:protein EMSY-LIKE 3-like [Olea europaea var. sylvestris]
MQSDMESEIHNIEQIAYAAVLRAFKAQSDALTWEKEGLITELRKELRVSDDEHRDLLTKVNADDLIRRIREWREAGGNRNVAFNVPQHVNDQLPSPTVSASRKKPKTSQSGNTFGIPSQSLHPQPATTHPLSSAGKWGPSLVMGGRRPNSGQQVVTPAKPTQYHINNLGSSGAPSANDLTESTHDPLIGRRVMMRWPADNNFYEAVIDWPKFLRRYFKAVIKRDFEVGEAPSRIPFILDEIKLVCIRGYLENGFEPVKEELILGKLELRLLRGYEGNRVLVDCGGGYWSYLHDYVSVQHKIFMLGVRSFVQFAVPAVVSDLIFML